MRGDKAGKDLFKLLNNAVFGKTLENLRKRINFEVVTSRKVALKRIAKPNFKRVKISREDLIGIQNGQACTGDESTDSSWICHSRSFQVSPVRFPLQYVDEEIS